MLKSDDVIQYMNKPCVCYWQHHMIHCVTKMLTLGKVADTGIIATAIILMMFFILSICGLLTPASPPICNHNKVIWLTTNSKFTPALLS